ncbi:succinate-semialdehyde dehydrogenase (NADP(+)) [Spiractinospora alimapuensis]|uniref:succinic semialdehyde dehydrogenase n=1 Tax=Spiractinospora alimapuensis TaxID=2820884 RepID=UPI001EEB781A|nr:succinic semialdehyde dehydrogenase [Spiractinospora alimapuensis]QVQ52991.1 succinate-semialdehyde dehydrogenase (NADP(+)) [Spiractinospora alimapuensis]
MTASAATPPDPRAGLPEGLATRLTRRVAATTRRPTTVTAPFTGAPLAELPQSSGEDIEAAFARAREAQAAWARVAPALRVKPFLRFSDLVLRRQREILDILQWETGKARRHAFEEVYDAAAATLYYARRAPAMLRPRRVTGAMPVATRAEVNHHPKGVVSVITPWNYPLTLPLADAVPALLAGNAVIAKPDTQTALSALWAMDLLEECGLPQNLWIPVVGEPADIGEALVDSADHVAFTGSTTAGATIAERCGARLIGCSAELGGKNPMVVRADADVERTVRGTLRAAFSNAGQLCIAAERLYVHESIHDRFVDRLASAVAGMELNSRFDFSADMGSLTYARQLDRTDEHVRDAVARGAEVLAGGHARPDLGPLFYAPTVLAGVGPEMASCRAETFGPLLAVAPFADDEEAVAMANDSDLGLNASVWTRDETRGRLLAARIQAGTVNVNDGYGAAFASYGGPMGGMKRSGLGRRHGPEGLLRFTEPQTVATQRLLALDGTPVFDPETWTKVMTRAGHWMRRLRL